MVFEGAQDHPFNGQTQDNHHDHGDGDGKPDGHAELVNQADAGEGGEEHHRPLGEVEHAGSLVDQDEADRHQRVHHAGEEAAQQHFEEESHSRLFVSGPCPDTR